MAKEIGNWGKQSGARQPMHTTRHGARGWTDDSRAIVEPLLESGETLLWSARGKGPYLRTHTILPFVLLLILSPSLLLAVARTAIDDAGVILFIYACVVVAGAISVPLFLSVRALMAPAFDRYALTTRRLIIVERFWPKTVRSYVEKDKYIDLLEVPSGRTGEVRLRKIRSKGALRPFALVGIDKPREVAELIKSTLKLDLPITDGKLYIPPTDRAY